MKKTKPKIQKSSHHLARHAFTLIEMMVAVALVLLMMTLFAQVFQTAAETMSLQKGVAENDQRSRTLNTIIRNDLQNRTFKKLDPWDNSINETNTDSSIRTGYFYISENSLDDQTDDVLQFTVEVDSDGQPLFGRAKRLGLITDIDQPEGDDGQIDYDGAGTDQVIENSQGASYVAEVSYFLRNGNLYRRVLLVRQQFSGVGTWPVQFNDATIYPVIDNFWSDFDYSAHYEGTGIRLHRQAPAAGIWISNNPVVANSSLGEPRFRFGHYLTSGNPLEFIENPPTVFTFIGRYTHQETSDSNFLYPGSLPDWDGGGPYDPMDISIAPVLTVSNNGIVQYNDGAVDTEFNGDRVGEDILLSRVHSFDVKVWDENVVPPAFVDVGHNIAGGDFNQTNNLLPAYGPQATNRIFDTWYTDYDHPANGVGADEPPFRLGASGNTNAVKAVQITIRFFDVSSGQTRQITIVEAMN